MSLQLLRDRIQKRSAHELRNLLFELRDVLPSEIKLVECVEERPVLGKCLIEKVVVDDKLLGSRQFILRAFEFEAVVNLRIANKPFEKYREITDEEGGPLFNQEEVKQAVLDALDDILSTADEWIAFREKDSINHRSTLGRHAEDFPDIIRKGDRGEWFVIKSHAAKYIRDRAAGK